jgi:hypothetical protein
MRLHSCALSLAVVLLLFPAAASAQPIVFDGTVPEGPETHFFVPFEVPPGTVEIEVRHDDLSSENILDFGLEDPHGFRGWGGGNTEAAVVGEGAASRSYVPGPIDAGTWRVVIGKAKVNELPASYHLEIELRTEPTLTPQPERTPYVDRGVVDAAPGWYGGDFHVHSRESGDAHPTLDEIAELATSRGLRFVEISDHTPTTALDFFADVRSRYPSILFIPGVEFTTYAGHANGIGATAWVDHRIGVEGATIEDAIAAFDEQGALFSLNHPEFDFGDICIGCAWAHDVDPATIDAVEIMTTSTSIVQKVMLPPTVAFWDELCATGRHVAAIGGSDDHEAGMGTGTLASPVGDPTTMVYAENLSVDGILEGIRRGRTVVKITGVSAPMAILDSSEPLEGDTVVAKKTTLLITVTAGLDRQLRIVKNGESLGEQIVIDADPFEYELSVSAPSEGEDRYRVEVLEGASRLTITSHVWVKRPPGSSSGGSGGCSAAGGPGGATTLIGLALALLALGRRRARG